MIIKRKTKIDTNERHRSSVFPLIFFTGDAGGSWGRAPPIAHIGGADGRCHRHVNRIIES